MTRYLLLVPWLMACSDSSFLSADESATGASDYGGSYTAGDDDDDGAADTGGGEVEEDVRLQLPAQTDRYVFVPNPDRDTLTRIHVESQDVLTVVVGDQPDQVVTTPDYRRAITFCRGEDAVRILDAESMDQTKVEVRAGLNAMQVSGDGAWAVLWADVDGEDPSYGQVLSFNELSLVDVETGEHFAMAVGPYPRQLTFTEDGRRLAVLSDAWMAVIDLEARPPVPVLYELDEDRIDAPLAEEMLVGPDGSYALVRQLGAEDLLWVDLDRGDLVRIPAGLNPTDLDLSPDRETLVVLARGSTELWVFDAEDPRATPRVVDLPGDEAYGSLTFADDGSVAALYTNASLISSILLWDPVTDEFTSLPLVKPVTSLTVAPQARALVVFHTTADGPDDDLDSPFRGKPALSLVDLDGSLLTNALVLDEDTLAYRHSPTGEYGYFVMNDVPQLVQLDYTTLLHASIPLPSPPAHLGVLPPLAGEAEPTAWISQVYALGRLSFYHPNPPTLETITGFELNSGIEED